MEISSFRVLPLLRNTFQVVSQVLSRGGLFSIKTGFRTMPLVFHLSDHFRLNRLMNSDSLQGLIKQQPRLGYKYLGSYLANNFSMQTRLDILYHHYDYLTQQVHGQFFGSLLDGLVLWQNRQGDDMMSIQMSFPSGIDFEGDLALTFIYNDLKIYHISFVVAPGPCVHSTREQVLLVSRVQGTKNFEAIRQCTKSCYDITPAAMLIAALQGIANAFGIKMLVGISNEERIHKTIIFDFDSFWEAFEAEKTQDNLFFLPLPIPRKSIDLIKGKRRHRTLRKRQYKDEICQSVQERFAQYLLKQQLSLN